MQTEMSLDQQRERTLGGDASMDAGSNVVEHHGNLLLNLKFVDYNLFHRR